MRSRALRIVRAGEVDVVDVEVPRIGPGQLLVEVRVGGICRGDIEVYRGDPDTALPYLGGHESSGIVREIGPTVTDFAVGDNVTMLGDGRFSEYTVADAEKSALLPATIADWRNWVVEPAACAVNGVEVAGVRFDDVVGVVGCGYMGQLVIRALALTPLRQLPAFDIQPAALERALASGATSTHLSASGPEEIAAEVDAIVRRRPMPNAYVLPGLENGPLDIAFETSGTAAGLRLASRLVRVGGTVVMFGHQRGELTVDGSQWHSKGTRVLNASPMSAPYFHDTLRRTAQLVTAGRLRLDGLVSHSAPLDQAARVYEGATDPAYVKGAVTFGGAA
jgi:threonine dehydrogenase-like Zn-dependent dehydrogenase